MDQKVGFEEIDVNLAAHHVHWVAPREPGYSNEGPFKVQLMENGKDIGERYSDLRMLMNQSIQNHYEADASFSSTTGFLAAQLAMALLDNSGKEHQLHAPAPNGLPGGYPVTISHGAIELRLAEGWSLDALRSMMETCHTLDGVAGIDADGSVRFSDSARDILQQEMAFELPAQMKLDDVEEVAQAQIAVLNRQFALYA